MKRGFDAMIADLVERGLLDADGRLTDAGMVYTDKLMDELRSEPPPPAIQGTRGRWRAQGGLA